MRYSPQLLADGGVLQEQKDGKKMAVQQGCSAEDVYQVIVSSEVARHSIKLRVHFCTRLAYFKLSSFSQLFPIMILPLVKAVTRGLRRGEGTYGVVCNQILCCLGFRPDWSKEVVEMADQHRNDAPCQVNKFFGFVQIWK